MVAGIIINNVGIRNLVKKYKRNLKLIFEELKNRKLQSDAQTFKNATVKSGLCL